VLRRYSGRGPDDRMEPTGRDRRQAALPSGRSRLRSSAGCPLGEHHRGL